MKHLLEKNLCGINTSSKFFFPQLKQRRYILLYNGAF